MKGKGRELFSGSVTEFRAQHAAASLPFHFFFFFIYTTQYPESAETCLETSLRSDRNPWENSRRFFKPEIWSLNHPFDELVREPLIQLQVVPFPSIRYIIRFDIFLLPFQRYYFWTDRPYVNTTNKHTALRKERRKWRFSVVILYYNLPDRIILVWSTQIFSCEFIDSTCLLYDLKMIWTCEEGAYIYFLTEILVVVIHMLFFDMSHIISINLLDRN